MPEARVDPLSGLRVLLAEDGPELQPGAAAPAARAAGQLFVTAAAEGEVEELALGAPLSDLDVDGVTAALNGLRERMAAHPGAACLHAQADAGEPVLRLWALASVPSLVARERERFAAYAAANYGANLLQDLVGEEVKLGERLVAVDDEAVLLAAFAPRAPFELLLVPRRTAPRFEAGGPTSAAMLHDALRRLRATGAGDPDVWVRTAPRGAESFCWHISLLPRAAPGGPAAATGLAVTRVAPERAADELRRA